MGAQAGGAEGACRGRRVGHWLALGGWKLRFEGDFDIQSSEGCMKTSRESIKNGDNC